MWCIFCKIIKGEIQNEKIFEDENVYAFMDANPITKGHVLVIPKKHSPNILETDDEVLCQTIIIAKKIAKIVVHAMNASGFNLNTNTGVDAGQGVFHLHFHIIPRYNLKELMPWPHHTAEPKTRQEIAAHIKEFFK